MKINTNKPFITAEIILEKGESIKIKAKDKPSFTIIFYNDFLRKKGDWINDRQKKN